MFYLSEVIGKWVIYPGGKRVARIRDVVAEIVIVEDAAQVPFSTIRPSTQESAASPPQSDWGDEEVVELDMPRIKGLLASEGRNQDLFFVPIDSVAVFDKSGVRLFSSSLAQASFERSEGEMLLVRDLWDKQVVDLEHRKVVRVNDVMLIEVRPTGGLPEGPGTGSGQALGRWLVRGVDIGLGGFIRRLHLGALFYAVARRPAHAHVVRWQHIDMFGTYVPGGVPLLHKKLARLHPVEIARITDAVSYHQGAEIIASLDDTLAADTLEEIVAERQTDIVENMPEERAADILEEMSPDEATDLLAELTEEKAGALLEQMDQEEAQEVRRLMRYPEKSAGGMMTTDFVRVLPEMTVGQVIDENKDVFLSADLIYYMYVVDTMENHNLLGVITVRDLLVHDRGDVVHDFMLDDFLSVRPGEREQEVARKMAEYNLLALPVADRNGTLLGVVTIDDALDAVLPEGWKKRLPRVFS
ncbi:MAG: CBS domain-containing protein [Chloroflexota bacterium]|nr:CBS domain-containing protein [Chloroflexota bacterium]